MAGQTYGGVWFRAPTVATLLLSVHPLLNLSLVETEFSL